MKLGSSAFARKAQVSEHILHSQGCCAGHVQSGAASDPWVNLQHIGQLATNCPTSGPSAAQVTAWRPFSADDLLELIIHRLQAQRTIEEQKAALKDQEMERNAAAQNRGRLAAAQKQVHALEWEHEVSCPSRTKHMHACRCFDCLSFCMSVRLFSKRLARQLGSEG